MLRCLLGFIMSHACEKSERRLITNPERGNQHMEQFNTLEVINMKHLLKASLATFFVALLCLTFSLAAQTPTIPDTPAGRTLQAWLDAFNSGERGRLEAYLTKYEPAKSVDSELNFRDQTGGFELVRIAQTDRRGIEVKVQEKARPTNGGAKI